MLKIISKPNIKQCPNCSSNLKPRVVGHSYTKLDMTKQDIDWYFENVSKSEIQNTIYVCENCSYCE
ncbi:MAG: hypothetical protein ACOC3Z_00580 [Nanoarchaeota archaeon]